MTSALRRLEDWPSRLDAAVEAARQQRFALGRWDCVRFAAHCIAAMTGVDLYDRYRGTYRDWRSARRMLRQLDAADLHVLVTGFLGEPLPGAALARRGDVVLVPGPVLDGIGVCLGRLCAVPDEGAGLDFVELSTASAAWRV